MTRLTALFQRFGFSAALIGGGRVSFLLLYALAARFADSDAFGLFVISLAAGQLLAIFCSLGFSPTAQAVIPPNRDHRPWRVWAYVRLSLLTTLLLSLGVAAVCLGGAQLASRVFAAQSAAEILFAIAIFAPVMAFSVLREFLARAFEQVAMAFIPRDILWTLCFSGLIVVWPMAQAEPVLVGAVLLALIEAVAYAVFWLRDLRPLGQGRRIPLRLYRRWFKRSLALMVNYLGGLGFERVDVIAVGFFTTLETAGIYGAANRVATLISMSQRFIIPVISPRIARALSQGPAGAVRHEVSMGVRAGLGLALPATLFVLIFAEWIMELFNPSFTSGALYLRILAIAQLAIALGSNFGAVTMMGATPWRYGRAIWSALIPVGVLLILGTPFGGASVAAVITAFGIIAYNAMLIRLAWSHVSESPQS